MEPNHELWDDDIAAFQDSNKYFRDVAEALMFSLSMANGSDEQKRQYIMTYWFAITPGGKDNISSIIKELQSNYPDSDVGPYISAFNKLESDYENKVGVASNNVTYFPSYSIYALLKEDENFLRMAHSKFPGLGYLSSWPGYLLELVKRKAIGDSTVGLYGVARRYPHLLVHHLKRTINYRDIAILFLDFRVSNGVSIYNGLRYEILRHAGELSMNLYDNFCSRVKVLYPAFPMELVSGPIHVVLNEIDKRSGRNSLRSSEASSLSASRDSFSQLPLRGSSEFREAIMRATSQQEMMEAMSEESSEESSDEEASVESNDYSSSLDYMRRLVIGPSVRPVFTLLNEIFKQVPTNPATSPVQISMEDGLNIARILCLLYPSDASVYRYLVHYFCTAGHLYSQFVTAEGVVSLDKYYLRDDLIRCLTGKPPELFAPTSVSLSPSIATIRVVPPPIAPPMVAVTASPHAVAQTSQAASQRAANRYEF